MMDAPYTLSFDTFWKWLLGHPNCILRAGTPESVFYDDDDLHWHFAMDNEQTFLVQILRGKRLIGELLVDPEPIAYVEALPEEQEHEHLFELITEDEGQPFAAYFFVLTHAYDGESPVSRGRIH
jgi:hypothetical protein